MPSFSNLEALREHKTYVPLLKKALLTVKPDTQKKFLYFKQYPFGQKKLPLVLVDYDPNCQMALVKAGHKPTAEGLVSLTTKDELNFEAKKGELKRARIQNYFGMMGGGIKVVYVPPGETDDDAASATAPATPVTAPATAPKTSATPTDAAAQAKTLLARIEDLRKQTYPPGIEAKKEGTLAKVKEMVQANKLPQATMVLNELASKALPAAEAATAAPAATGGPKVDLGGLKWNRWFREKPVWPQLLAKATWEKNKGALAKMTLSTGLGDQLKACEAAFGAAVAKMPVLKGDAAADVSKSMKECQGFMADATMKALADGLKTLRDLASKAASDSAKNALIPKSTSDLCRNIASAADALMVSCQPNSLKGCLDGASNANDERVKLDKAWKLDELKGEKDPAKRITLCQKLLEGNPDRSPQRDLVEDILAQALKEQSVGKAKDAYAAQMKDAKDKFHPKNLQGGVPDSQKLQEIMKKTGLNEGEIMAIRAYTGANYEYINPAIANQKDRTDKGGKDWMNQNRPKGKSADDARKKFDEGSADQKGSKKSYYEEGALHAGMMMEAFKKLPKYGKTTVYRGTRMTPAEFKETYAVGKVITYEAFASQSQDKKTAREYTTGMVKTPPRDATTSVFIVSEVTSARDVMAISVFDSQEAELLSPPGTKLRVDKIEDDTEKVSGDPPATEWKVVYLTEV